MSWLFVLDGPLTTQQPWTANDVLLDKMFTEVIKGALTEVDDYDKKSLPTEDPVRMTANAKWRGKLGQLEKSAITKQGYTEDVADKVVGRFGLNDREDDSSPYDTMDEVCICATRSRA